MRKKKKKNLLTKEIAEQFLADKNSVNLRQLTTIEDEAAESLSKYGEGMQFEDAGLYLEGLTELSDAAAESLSKHRGEGLFLKGLAELSDVAAESLSKYQGGGLRLGLTELSDAAAKSLSKFTGWLELNGLTALSEAAADSLSKHQGWLYLNGLTTLSDAAAESLSKHQGKGMYLSGLTALSDAAAKSLSRYTGYLEFHYLKTLSDQAATNLLACNVDVRYICGLRRYLKDLTPTTVNTAFEILLNHKSIKKTFTNEIAKRIFVDTSYKWEHWDSNNRLDLSRYTHFEDEALLTLTNYSDRVILNGLMQIPDSFLNALPKASFGRGYGYSTSALILDGVKNLNISELKILQGVNYRISLNGVKQISDEMAELLCDMENPPFLSGLTEYNTSSQIRLAKFFVERRRSFEGLVKITPELAHVLAELDDTLHLDSLAHLSDEAASILSKHEGELILKGLTSLSDAAAKSLSKHKGDLDLGGLTTLSDAAAESLSKHKGSLDLYGLEKLSDLAATSLAKHKPKLDSSDIELGYLPATAAKILRDAGHGG